MVTEIELNELKEALRSEFKVRAIRMSTIKLPCEQDSVIVRSVQPTYLKAVGTKELDRILEDVFSKFEPCKNENENTGFWP